MFHQVEGLWVDENISFADLKSVYTDFLHRFFERDDIDVRFRPSYFPFTEPLVEIDMRFADGPLKGRWLEVSGSGQVHPNVVRNLGLDPEKHIGFAFGSGKQGLAVRVGGGPLVDLFLPCRVLFRTPVDEFPNVFQLVLSACRSTFG